MKNSNKRKGFIGTLLMALLMLITGTFAWTALSQRALNEKEGTTAPGGRVHDDYDKKSGNKDIYAENYGKQNLLVRIKLSEYLETNGKALVAESVKDERNTWTPYVLPETVAPSSGFRDYVTWDLGGEKVFLPTFNTDKTDLSVDTTGDAIDFVTEGQTAVGNGLQNYFENNKDIINPDDESMTHTTKNTIVQTNEPISVAAWEALSVEEQTGDYWIIDEDGWAYWANILAPNDSTSLLLDQINFNELLLANYDTWYYGIDVIGEFVTIGDKDKFPNSEHGGVSDAAQKLIDSLSSTEKEETFSETIEFTTDVTSVEMGSNREQQFGAKFIKKSDLTGEIAEESTDLTWSISPTESASIDQTGKVTLKDFSKETVLTVTAAKGELETSFELTARAAFKVAIGATFDFHGKSYIHLKDLGQGNHLILSEKALTARSSNNVDYNKGNVNTAMKNYYESLEPAAKKYIQPVQKEFEVGMVSMASAGLDADNFLVTNAPKDRATVTENGEKKAFALSLDELNDVSGAGKAFPTKASRGVPIEDALTAAQWLRTPMESTKMWGISYGNTSGNLSDYSTTTNLLVRPALIINQ